MLLGASLTPDEITAMFMTGAIPSLDGRLRLISAAMFVVSSALSRFCKRREGTA